MAKTLSSICFTALLLAVLLISAEIPRSEAQCTRFLGEGPEGTPSNPCRERQCLASCRGIFTATCAAECVTHDNEDHCHCLGR